MAYATALRIFWRKKTSTKLTFSVDRMGVWWAQCFVRQYSVQGRSLILAHTFVFNPEYAKPLWLASNLAQALFVAMLKLRLYKILYAKLRAAHHPETEFWRAYLNEAMASNVMKEVFVHQNKCLLELAQHP